jgi:hypothetical protein
MKPSIAGLIALTLFTVLSTRAAHADWSHDARVPNPLIPYIFSNQRTDAAVPDGNGGVYVFFEDDRNGTKDVYGMHVLANGVDDPAWPVNGLLICNATGDQTNIKAVSDGAGGIWVVWSDGRSGVNKNYLSHVDGAGTIQGTIPANGLLLDSSRPNAQGPPQISADPFFGVFVVWQYAFSVTDSDIFGARVGTDNSLVWCNGIAISTAVQTIPVACVSQGDFQFAYYEGSSTVIASRVSSTMAPCSARRPRSRSSRPRAGS